MANFLETVFKSLRCQNPECQAEATQDNRIRLRHLLHGGWTCSYCGWEYAGALESGGTHFVEAKAPVNDIAEAIRGSIMALLEDAGPLRYSEIANRIEADVVTTITLGDQLLAEKRLTVTEDGKMGDKQVGVAKVVEKKTASKKVATKVGK